MRSHQPRRAWADGALATLLSAGVFVVHPLSYVLHHPFWLDEACPPSLGSFRE